MPRNEPVPPDQPHPDVVDLTAAVSARTDDLVRRLQSPGGPDEDRSGGFEHGGWMGRFVDEAFGEVVDGWFARTDALLFGRHTYDVMASYWPHVTDPQDATAARLNAAPKHVVSRTLAPERATWNNTVDVIGDDVAERIRALKASGEGNLQVHGSWRLIQALTEHGLVDEYHVIQFPTVVGAGKRLFDTGTPAGAFEVSDVRTTGTGAIAMVLRPTPFQVANHAVVEGRDTVV